MTQETTDKIKKVIFSEVFIAVSIAGAVFWGINYISNPVNKIELEIIKARPAKQ